MTRFKPGQTYNVRRWRGGNGSPYGTCTIIAVEEKPESEINWTETSVKNNFDADIGTITFILNTASNNDKPKKATLRGARVSEDWAKTYNCDLAYQWFSPTKRSYTPISAEKDTCNA